jgi:sialate O-acetylesterase
LSAHAAGGPYRLTIGGKTEEITYKDIYFGDVWLASGQSNMEHPMRGWEWLPESAVYHFEKELADTGYPMIRLCSIPKCPSPVPMNDIYGCRWEVADSSSVAGFSAPGWFFAKYLHQNLNIPIGIIHSSWGGTSIKTWMNCESSEELSRERSQEKNESFDEEKWARKMTAINEQTRQRRCGISYSMKGLDESTGLQDSLSGLWKVTGLNFNGQKFTDDSFGTTFRTTQSFRNR